MMKTKASQPNKLVRLIKTPFRALCKARDFYVRSMMSCADRNIVGLQGTSQSAGLPRNFSVSSARSSDTDEDYRELFRAASARSSIGLDAYVRQEMARRPGSRAGPRAMPPRSISVAMGRIDEERPCCYFGGDVIVNVKGDLMYPRSKSHHAATTTTI